MEQVQWFLLWNSYHKTIYNMKHLFLYNHSGLISSLKYWKTLYKSDQKCRELFGKMKRLLVVSCLLLIAPAINSKSSSAKSLQKATTLPEVGLDVVSKKIICNFEENYRQTSVVRKNSSFLKDTQLKLMRFRQKMDILWHCTAFLMDLKVHRCREAKAQYF